MSEFQLLTNFIYVYFKEKSKCHCPAMHKEKNTLWQTFIHTGQFELQLYMKSQIWILKNLYYIHWSELNINLGTLSRTHVQSYILDHISSQ